MTYECADLAIRYTLNMLNDAREQRSRLLQDIITMLVATVSLQKDTAFFVPCANILAELAGTERTIADLSFIMEIAEAKMPVGHPRRPPTRLSPW
jgi:hypothetical protein